MNCQKCGKENTSSSKFCLGCGNPLPAEAKSQVGQKADVSLDGRCLGMKTNIAAALSYALGFITGAIFYLAGKNNKFVRFNAVQSICLSIGAIVLSSLLSGIPALVGFLNLAILVLWIVLMVKAGQGKYFKIPLIGNFAEKQS